MPFIVADTFYDSLRRLDAAEQKAAKQAAFDLYANPKGDGFRMHRVERSRDRNFWSARVGADIRFILHRMKDSLLLCFVGHHDPAYAWAERHAVQVHPETGAAQLLRFEAVTVAEEAPPPTAKPPASGKPLFSAYPDETLLAWGAPEDSLPGLRGVTNEEQLLAFFAHIPEEALEALRRQTDAALLQGLKSFAVVHGKGDGILQNAVHEYLKNEKSVASFNFSRPELGGFGRTEVIMKL